MPGLNINDIRVEVSFVTETTTRLDVNEEAHTFDNTLFELVDKEAFIRLCAERDRGFEAANAWDNLFGNLVSSDDGVSEPNPHFRYLTRQSFEKIWQYRHLFVSGIDFEHLPAGFFIAKNPAGGVCDVLHYSEHIAAVQKDVSPLAMVLSPKEAVGVGAVPEPPFEGPKKRWYEALKRQCKSISNPPVWYCTEEELQKAFVAFSNTVEGLGLSFFEYSFYETNYYRDINPIVLLGRFATVLTNRHLKATDLTEQWQVLPRLFLAASTDAIRAITDYEHEVNPCAFLLPEMDFDRNALIKLRAYHRARGVVISPGELGCRHVQKAEMIGGKRTFWRYLAYQPKRNSIVFYKNAIKEIDSLWPPSLSISENGSEEYLPNIDCPRIKMLQLLAASTTGENHIVEDEDKELASWVKLCKIISETGSDSATLRTIRTIAGDSYIPEVRKKFVTHLSRLSPKPNMLFLTSLAKYIATYIHELSPPEISLHAVMGTDPFQRLVDLSDKLDQVVKTYGNDFYQGSKFFFVNEEWKTLDIKTYIELQKDFSDAYPLHAKLLVAHLSTFNIKDKAGILNLCRRISLTVRNDLLVFTLDLFKDIKTRGDLNKEDLYELINYIQTHSFGTAPIMEILDYLNENSKYNSLFEEGYFAGRKRRVRSAALGLTPAQIALVRSCRFSSDQEKAIIQMESILVSKNQLTTDAQLLSLNNSFMNLRRLILPEDFTIFTERLASIAGQCLNAEEIRSLLTLLVKNRSLESFNQIFIRNTIEHCMDEQVINKFSLFIEKIRPLTNVALSMDRTKLQEALAMVVLHTKITPADYVGDLTTLIGRLNTIVQAHPHIQHYVLDCFNHIVDKGTPRYFDHVKAIGQTMVALNDILPAGTEESHKENMLTIYSLLAYYRTKGVELTALVQQINRLSDTSQKRFLLMFVSRLLDNNQSIEGLETLITRFLDHSDELALVSTTCTTPPYPDIQTLTDWLTTGDFGTKYVAYCLEPYGKRSLESTFNNTKYLAQRSQFKALEPADLFSPALGGEIEGHLIANRAATIQSLIHEFQRLKAKSRDPLNNEEKLQLLCISIEILARTASQQSTDTPPRLISQELNTTQVMALYAMLANPSHKLISEIDTGEGKSRIMMLLAACQAGQGKTVDFITSDMQLAERDYLTYKQFFTALGIRTSLISLSTPPQLYQKGGINFSDNSQLLLLRNKSDITRSSVAYLDERPTHRCLLIDEVDKFKHDKSKDAYNYAATSKKLAGFTWIYPHLVRFMQKQIRDNAGIEPTIDVALVEKFITHAERSDTSILHRASLAELNAKNPNQLKTWLHSAYIALQMENDKHYKLTEADDSKLFAVRDVEGNTRFTRKVLVLDNGRPMEGSSFSDGVHQCLCARENIKLDKEAFVIMPENETQRASYPVTFMSAYDEGAIYGVSGTSRSEAPRAKSEVNYEDYHYLIVPREKALIRDDKNTWVAKDQAQQISYLKRAIIDKIKKGQPTLLICKDDQQSFALYKALESDRHFKKQLKKLQRVHGLTSPSEEKDAITSAGLPGSLTISTAGMFGRGVDINSANLFVIAAYVPTIEDEKQIKGRTARIGKPGEFRMILDASDSTSINSQTYNIDNEVVKFQKRQALSAVFREEVSKLYALFLEEMTRNFLKGYNACAEDERAGLLEQWQVYLSQLQKDWREHGTQLLSYVEAEQKARFSTCFNQFTKKWLALMPEHRHKAEAKTLEQVKIDKIYSGLLSQKSFFVPKRQSIKTQLDYDYADNGQARIYSSLCAQTLASLRGEREWFANYRAWKEGRGVLFADLKAVLSGERPIFANLMATIRRLLDPKSASDSHADHRI